MSSLLEQNIFTNLPSEITTNILSWLPIRGIAISKCFCKPWLNLLGSLDFAKSKIKAPAALAGLMWVSRNSIRCTISEIDDEGEADLESHDLHYIPLTDIDIPHAYYVFMEFVTANGLLLLYCSFYNNYSDDQVTPLYIYSLMTREYIMVGFPEEVRLLEAPSFGFGVSKISEEYKVLCASEVGGPRNCYHAYSLGTGTWRHLEAGPASC